LNRIEKSIIASFADSAEQSLKENTDIKINGQDDAELLQDLQNHRRRQYEILTDTVYAEKGFDLNGIPLDETLDRLGFTDPEYLEIVEQARRRQ